MKKVLALVLAVAMLATMGGVALAQVEPPEVNIVLPDGEMATITKDVTIGDVGTVDVWGEVEYPLEQTGLTVTLSAEQLGVVTPVTPTVSFSEEITIDAGGPKYATVTFYYGVYAGTVKTKIGEQAISVTEGDLDIKPGSYPNSINRKKNGVTPVALLGHDGFDVRTVDVATLTFGPDDAQPKHDLTDSEVYEEHIQDVNFDGNPDLVCHFKTKAADLPTVGEYLAGLDYDLETPVGLTTIYDSVRVIK
jgi:hypothetical protein